MKERSSKHATFVIEKHYKQLPDQVFAAWAEPEAKAMWFPKADRFDFRIGGGETNKGAPPGGPVYIFDAVYQDIVPNSRIVYSYTMDGHDTPEQREHGTKVLLDKLGDALNRLC